MPSDKAIHVDTSKLQPTSSPTSSEGRTTTPRSPLASAFGLAKSVASTALHAAQVALDGDMTEQPYQHIMSSLTRAAPQDALIAASTAIAQGGVKDDRKMLLEDIIVLLYSLPEDSSIGHKLENALIALLWDDLQHPPVSFVGRSKFRSADGSGNNHYIPRLGAAGEPYARSVAQTHPMPRHLPNTEDVWNQLMKRDRFEPHPSGISSLLFAFATIITHTCFSTNRQDPSINDASSYLDLSPLYGNNQIEQDRIRAFTDGKIFDDVIASQRLFLMPPATCALMIVFSRNHNWIVDRLYAINQNKRFKPWAELSDEQRVQQDNELFQTARLVNCGWFLQVILGDYIPTILNVNQTDSTWMLDPTKPISPFVAGPQVERGTGNVVSVEFNILYRWHACIGEKDAAYIEQLIRRHSQTPFAQMTAIEFARVSKDIAMEMGPDARTWTFGGLKRKGKNGTGRFSDDEIARVLVDATEEVAGAFKARGVPQVMRIFDIMGMEVARNEWACASLNEFRSFLKLDPYNSFEEWNEDPVIADAARRLYRHIDHLELMPGLSAEQPKPTQPGSGLAPGFTISRAILSDAVALVRGDRYFAYERTAGNLTSFHYNDLQPEPQGGAFGGALGKLLMRTFPAHYTYNSTYALFPFSTPSTTNGVLSKLGFLDQYDTRRPSPPPEWVVIDRRAAAEQILAPEFPLLEQFAPVYGAPLDVLKQQEPSFLSLLSSFKTKLKARSECQEVIDSAFFPSQFTNLVVAAIAPKARAVLAETSWSAGASQMRVDVVEQVIVPVCMSWISDQLGFPLKTKTNPLGLLTPVELYDTLCEAYTYLHLNYDPTRGFKLRNLVIEHTRVLKNVIDFRLSQANGSPTLLHNFAQDVKELLLGSKAGQGIVMSDHARQVYDRVLRVSSRPLDEIADTLLYSMINFVSSVSSCAKTVDFFLRPENASVLQDLQSQMAVEAGLANESIIQHYVNECLRLDPAVEGFVRQAQSDLQILNGPHIKKGTLLYIDWTRVNRDPSAFPKPNAIKLDRNPKLYQLAEPGIRSSRDESIGLFMTVAIVKELFKFSDLRFASGYDSEAIKIEQPLPARSVTLYLTHQHTLSYFPQSLEILYSTKQVEKRAVVNAPTPDATRSKPRTGSKVEVPQSRHDEEDEWDFVA
ncbi:peroxidase/cytochrome P450 family protein [Sporobolomyces koalae]|uniref:peroxidase/cytochrome P450 family protein n=1 Tax=Sporobolomyces koalae TaxID=500713 RepID=UPI003181182E